MKLFGRATLPKHSVTTAFFLGFLSWLLLMPIWIHSSPGGLVDRVIGTVFSPAYLAGKHLAHLAFPNSENRNTTAHLVAPLTGVAGELLELMTLWFVGIRVLYTLRARRHYHRKPDLDR